MDCFNNTCLSCDCECEGHYCSQACKLADIERGVHTSASTSPITPASPLRSKSWQNTRQHPSHMPPSPPIHSSRPMATDFRYSGSRSSTSSSATVSAESARPTERSLTPSSSRSSLSSTASSSGSTYYLSTQNNQQLQDYFSSFEKVRAAKRRSSLR